MKKKNILIITSISIFGSIIIFIMLINLFPQKLDNILKENNYVLVSKTKKGTKIGDITVKRDIVKYTKDKMSIIQYKYESLEEIKKEVFIQYQQYESSGGFENTYKDEEKYIYLCACDTSLCFYSLGYETELVQVIVNIDEKKTISELFEEIIKKKKLL